jgi:hypothetical protein
MRVLCILMEERIIAKIIDWHFICLVLSRLAKWY